MAITLLHRLALLALTAACLVACESDTQVSGRSDQEAQWFTDVTASSGIVFTHEAGVAGEMYLPEIVGAGVALLDVDNDGDLDIYLLNGNRLLPEAGVSQTHLNRLFVQQPDGRFLDVTEDSGLGDGGYGTGVAAGDLNNDGRVDLYVANYGEDRVYLNAGDGVFEDATAAMGIRVSGWSSSVAICDYDRDGWLDIYVVRYVDYTPDPCLGGVGQRVYCGPQVRTPFSDVLLHNDGDGTFSDVSAEAGMTSVAAAGLGVVCEDLDADGWPDIYVANDASANQLWVNQRDGSFRDTALLMGAAVNLHGEPEAGMGVLAADLDNDLDSDLFMTHLYEESNTLYRNLGEAAGFEDYSSRSGLGLPSIPLTGFGTVAFDADHDGDLDIVVVNGRVKRQNPIVVTSSNLEDLYGEPNLLFMNQGDMQFVPAGDGVAEFTSPVEITRGLAVGDIDNDGDLDLVLTNVAGMARVYRNDMEAKGHWLKLRLFDPALNRDALGARVIVTAGDRRFTRTLGSAASYQSSMPLEVHVGLGNVEHVDGIEVYWPDGEREVFPGVAANQRLTLHRGQGRVTP